ncbi:potassium transporter KtrB [Lactobacillus agilis] [Dolosigranulum pigrum]|nr:potassium transporter KtrB [Lactobacillus agilis] [Dolosigranulum pigrum]
MLHQFNKLSIPLKISLSFLVTVLIGSGLLSLPISQAHSSEAVFFDHLFTAISMVCVTGL